MIAALIAAAIAAPGASALDWPPVAGWDIVEIDRGCAAHMEFEGKGATELSVYLGADGLVFFSAENGEWSSREDDEYDVRWVVNGAVYGGVKAIGTRPSSDGKHGVMARIDPKALDDIAKGSGLAIYLDDRMADNLSLTGSAAAIAAVRRCVAAIRSRQAVEAAEKAKWSHLPDDPFASPPRERPPAPLGDRRGWISADDYPAGARIEGRHGVTIAKLAISPEGRVAGCSIARTSGHADLDQAACVLYQRRGRFSPAVGAGGAAVGGEYLIAHAWSASRTAMDESLEDDELDDFRASGGQPR